MLMYFRRFILSLPVVIFLTPAQLDKGLHLKEHIISHAVSTRYTRTLSVSVNVTFGVLMLFMLISVKGNLQPKPH